MCPSASPVFCIPHVDWYLEYGSAPNPAPRQAENIKGLEFAPLQRPDAMWSGAVVSHWLQSMMACD
jgi:hypothetical protein